MLVLFCDHCKKLIRVDKKDREPKCPWCFSPIELEKYAKRPSFAYGKSAEYVFVDLTATQ